VLLETSALTLLEVLVGPLKSGNVSLAATYESLLHSREVQAHAIDDAVLREAARLRSILAGLRTPDAIHGATAILTSPDIFLTNDPDFRKVPGLPVTVLSDLLTP
jgi:predicted nucleic acid-binding protein